MPLFTIIGPDGLPIPLSVGKATQPAEKPLRGHPSIRDQIDEQFRLEQEAELMDRSAP